MQVTTSRIDEIAGDDKELKSLLLQLFTATFEKCLKNLTESLSSEDEKKSTEAWERATHELKGSAYNLGFNELGDRCKNAEYLPFKSKDKDKFIKILNVIYIELDKMVNSSS